MAELLSGPLQVERLSDGKRKLLRDLVIDLSSDLGLRAGQYPGFAPSEWGTTTITVPEGFVTDFSSIPGFARALFRFDSVDLAGCCHDLAYYVGVPKPIADEVWRLVATSGESRIDDIRGRLGWLGLRLGGWVAYRKHATRRRARNRAAT